MKISNDGALGRIIEQFYLGHSSKGPMLGLAGDDSAEVVVYARYSTDEQKVSSIQRQVDVCTRYMRKLGITRYRIVTDIALSARQAINRPGLQSLLQDSARNKVKKIFVEAYDRWSREIYDAVEIAEILERNNVEFYCGAEERMYGKADATAAAIIAENDRKRRRNLTSAGRYQAARDGLIPTGGLIFGYVRSSRKGRPLKDEEAARIVRKVFLLGGSGSSEVDIARRLTADGEVGPGGRTDWTHLMVRAILIQPQYAGRYFYGRAERVLDRRKGGKRRIWRTPEDVVMVPCEHLRIVSDEAWVAANARRRRRGQRAFGTKTHLLSNRVRCDCPGAGNAFYTHERGGLTCGYRKAHGRCAHHPIYLSQGVLEGAVLAAVRDRLAAQAADGRTFAHQRERAIADLAAERAIRRKRLDKQIASRKASIKRLADRQFRDEYEDDALVAARVDRLHVDLERLVARRLAIRDAPREGLAPTGLAEELSRLVESVPFVVENMADQHVRDALRRIVRKVVLSRADHASGRAKVAVHLDFDAMHFESDEASSHREPEVVEREVDLLERASRTRIAAQELRRKGLHRLDEAQWSAIEPLLPPGLGDYVSRYGMTVRDVADELMASLITGDKLRGKGKVVGRAIANFLYHGGADSVVEGLRREHPHVVATLHLAVLDVSVRRLGDRRHHGFKARFEERRLALTDAQWEGTRHHVTPNVATARHDRTVDVRRLLDACLFMLRVGIGWSKLPARFGSWRHVRSDLKRAVHSGSWDRILLVWRKEFPEILEGLDPGTRFSRLERGVDAERWVRAYRQGGGADYRRLDDGPV